MPEPNRKPQLINPQNLWKLKKLVKKRKPKAKLFSNLPSPKVKIPQNGINRLSPRHSSSTITKFLGAIFLDPLLTLFGNRSQNSLMLSSRLMALKTLISLCLWHIKPSWLNKITSKVSPPKSLGSLKAVLPISRNPSLSDPLLKLLCTLLMLDGFRVTDIYPWNSISGQTS